MRSVGLLVPRLPGKHSQPLIQPMRQGTPRMTGPLEPWCERVYNGLTQSPCRASRPAVTCHKDPGPASIKAQRNGPTLHPNASSMGSAQCTLAASLTPEFGISAATNATMLGPQHGSGHQPLPMGSASLQERIWVIHVLVPIG